MFFIPIWSSDKQLQDNAENQVESSLTSKLGKSVDRVRRKPRTSEVSSNLEDARYNPVGSISNFKAKTYPIPRKEISSVYAASSSLVTRSTSHCDRALRSSLGLLYIIPRLKFEKRSPTCHTQGCGVGVEAGVGVGRSRPCKPESELESVKFCRLRLRPGVAGCHPSTNDKFSRTAIHPSGNIERQE